MRSLLRRLRRDSGFTLVELCVTVGLLGVIGSITVTTISGALRTSTQAQERGQDVAVARTTMDLLSRTLRTATDPDGDDPLQAFEVATGNEIRFYAALATLDGALPSAPKPPSLVTYTVDAAGVLTERIVPGVRSGSTQSWPAAGARTRVVATDLERSTVTGCASPSPRPYFSYLTSADGQAAAALDCGGGTTVTLPRNTALTATQRLDIAGIEVWVAVRGDDAYTGPPASLVNRVTLIN